MRTLSEMVAIVNRLLRDVNESAFDGDDVVAVRLGDALNMLAEDLVGDADARGRGCLLGYSTAEDLVADTELYDLPSDLLMLDRVEILWPEEDYWQPLPKRDPALASGMFFRSGMQALYGTGSAAAVSQLYWWDDCERDQFRVWPALTTVNDEEIRVRYYRRPAFPSTDSGTYNDPEATGTDVYRYPEGFVRATEFLAAAIIALEELEDGRPIGAFGQMYRGELDRLRAADGQRLHRPGARYVGSGR